MGEISIFIRILLKVRERERLSFKKLTKRIRNGKPFNKSGFDIALEVRM